MSERVRDIESQLRKTNQAKIDYSLSSSEGAEQIKARQKKEIESAQKKYEATKDGVKQETGELLDKEKTIQGAKELLYSKLGINNDQNKNSSINNFNKGIIDGLIIGNIELAIELWNTNGKILIEFLKQIASWEGIKQIANALGQSVTDLFSGDAYKTGKSTAELIISPIVGGGVAFGGGKLVKFLLKKGEKGVVKSVEIAGKAGVTKALDFEKMLVRDFAALGNEERLQAGRFVLKGKTLSPTQEQAIIKAHEVGNNRAGAKIYKYTHREKAEKINILKKAGFKEEERKILMTKGICGRLGEVEKTGMIDSITRLFGGDKIDAIKSSTSVAKRAELARELGIVPRFVGKKIEEVNQILKGEIEIIQNTKQSLGEILKGMDWTDRSLAESLLKRSNEWISIRLANLEKFVIFVEEASLQNMSDVNLVSATNSFKDKIINEGIIPLGKAMNELKNSGDLILNPRNEILLYNHYERLRGIKPHKISN